MQCEAEVLEEVQFNGAEQVQPESVEVEVEVQNLVESQVQPESGVLQVQPEPQNVEEV